MSEEKIRVVFLVTRVVQDGLQGTEDETRFEEGEVYALSPRSAERWVIRGVAEYEEDRIAREKLASEKEAEHDLARKDQEALDLKRGNRPENPEQLIVDIQEAINLLDRENEEHFTQDGKPRVEAIEEVLGYDISAGERDVAIADMSGND